MLRILLSHEVVSVLLLGGVLGDPVGQALFQLPLLQLGAVDHGEGASYKR